MTNAVTAVPKKKRKRRPAIAETSRLRIKTGMVLRQLQRHVQGEVDMKATQIKAAEILLKKTLPDLQSMSIEAGDSEVKFVISSEPSQSDMEWESQFCGETIEGTVEDKTKEEKPDAKVYEWVMKPQNKALPDKEQK